MVNVSSFFFFFFFTRVGMVAIYHLGGNVCQKGKERGKNFFFFLFFPSHVTISMTTTPKKHSVQQLVGHMQPWARQL